MQKENVFGIQVNSPGPAKLAKILLQVHMCFIALYCLSGVLSITSTFAIPAVIEDGRQEGRRGGEMQTAANTMWTGFMSLVLPLAVFSVVYFGLKSDSQVMVQAVMFLDGCCSLCACVMGGCQVLAISGFILFKAIIDAGDHCTCTAEGSKQYQEKISKPHVRDCSEPCSACFKVDDCEKGIEDFNTAFPLLMVFWSISVVFACCQAGLCAFAAFKLMNAQGQMPLQPFCRDPPAPVTGATIGSTVVMGQPVVGRPIDNSADNSAAKAS